MPGGEFPLVLATDFHGPTRIQSVISVNPWP